MHFLSSLVKCCEAFLHECWWMAHVTARVFYFIKDRCIISILISFSQIVRKDRPFYIQTANCVEEKEWVDLLNKICENNKRRLDTFHPCALINGMWTWWVCINLHGADVLHSTSAFPLQLRRSRSKCKGMQDGRWDTARAWPGDSARPSARSPKTSHTHY